MQQPSLRQHTASRASALVALVAAAACAAPRHEPRSPPAPATASAADSADSAGRAAPAAGAAGAAGARPRHTEADVRFLREMIPHHEQALAMTALVAERTDRREIRLIAERIEVSQHDEIAAMRSWLEARGQAAPDAASHHGQHGQHGAHETPMPGMLSAAEMARLAAVRGAEFDRVFLESMIRHHEGALAMVASLLATPGAAQEPQLYGIVADVDADQRAEIRRMRALLATLQGAPSAPPDARPDAPRR